MPVGHGGGMSRHPAWEKIAILELLEERLKIAAFAAGFSDTDVHVYDPFSTDMDFFIWFKKDWKDYLKLYSKYYDRRLLDDRKRLIERGYPIDSNQIESQLDPVGNIVLAKYDKESPDYETRKTILIKATNKIEEYDERRIFNASTSKSAIYYSICEMKNILEHGEPNP